MTVSVGTITYELGKPPCSGVGLCWSDEELDVALDGRVAAVLFDEEGKANIAEILAGSVGTDFAVEALQRVLKVSDQVEDWRVGEVIAETYLTDHKSCNFPWPDGRDERKRGSSLPGADLVGFGVDDIGHCLAFGEVKTSSENKHPPGTMYGRMGLKRQLEDLCDDESIRDNLVKYLCHRAGSAPWRERFEKAVSRYLKNSSDVQLYGFLVRDVNPHQDDLQVRVSSLGDACPKGTCIELLALYLPEESLDGIGGEIISRRAVVEQ